MARHPLRDAMPFPLEADLVESCLNRDDPVDAVFRTAFGLGYTPLWHFSGTGRHGIDLAMLSPAMDRIIVIEVKGTLRPRRLPRLTRGELAQLSGAWIDKRDNPGMDTLEMSSEDVMLHSVLSLDQLTELGWLDG